MNRRNARCVSAPVPSAPPHWPPRVIQDRAGADPAAPTMVTGTLISAARGVSRRTGDRPPAGPDPPATAGDRPARQGSAASVMAGVEGGLAQAVQAGLPPFAVVAGGRRRRLRHRRASGEDAGAMVLNELLPMLSEQGLDTRGWDSWVVDGRLRRSTGARPRSGSHRGDLRGEPGTVAAWATAPGAFDGADDYAANSVWGLPALASIPIRSTAATAPFLRRHQSLHRPVVQPAGRRVSLAGMTARSGVHSFPPRSRGWRRC